MSTERSARVTLWRAYPPFIRRVRVEPLTVRSYREAIKTICARVVEYDLIERLDKMTAEQVMVALGDVNTVSALADLLCPEAPRGFFKVWSSNYNLGAMMRGVVEVETRDGISAMWALLDWSGERVKKGGTIAADIIMIGRAFSMSPDDIFSMPMRHFLELCDLLSLSSEMAYKVSTHGDPTLDPDAPPTPLPSRPVTH